MAFPNSITILIPVFTGPMRLKSGLKDSKLSAVVLIWASRALKSYDQLSVGNPHFTVINSYLSNDPKM